MHQYKKILNQKFSKIYIFAGEISNNSLKELLGTNVYTTLEFS